MSDFQLYRKQPGKNIIQSEKLTDVFTGPQLPKEHWLFVAPHDDDVVIGGGMLLQKALEEDIQVSVLITTDGRMGYHSFEHRRSIVDIRRRETHQSFRIIDDDTKVVKVHWLNYPDGMLMQHAGRRRSNAKDHSAYIIEDHVGLQNTYTYFLRKLKPSKVFLPTEQDAHPDHKVVYQEALISVFHAAGTIWPELGSSLEVLPKVYEMAIYGDFSTQANIKVLGCGARLEKKIESIKAYESQKSAIHLLVAHLQERGPVEYFRDTNFNLHEKWSKEDDFS